MAKKYIATKVLEPYERGIAAARMGMSEESNPFRPGTDDHSDWAAGFKDFAKSDDFLESDN
jgi:hypothetical protein